MVGADSSLLIVGASARASAFSAIRAGFRPVCADLFADRDLRDCCPVIKIPASSYPQGFLNLDILKVPGPWMYTGGLENHPNLVTQLSRFRTLWGSPAAVLRKVRCPFETTRILADAGLPCPAVERNKPLARSGVRWLRKPLRGAGGRGIRFEGQKGEASSSSHPGFYWQEYLSGPALAAVYLADGKTALLVGVTRQLVGEVWLHAAPFHYCGSIGPVQLKLGLQEAFTRLGTALVSGCGLVGLFGVDAILRDGLPWPVEVNPRYTASVEVLELTLNVALLTEHRKAFEQKNPASAGQDCIFSKAFTSTEEKLNSPVWADFRGPRIGKAILFAPRSFVFPGTPAWDRDQAPEPFLPRPFALADIPVRGTKIKARQPVFTLFFKADTETACLQGLKEICADLDRRFFGA